MSLNASSAFNKINGASVLELRISETTNQFLMHKLEQLLVQTKRTRDAEAQLMDAHLFQWPLRHTIRPRFVLAYRVIARYLATTVKGVDPVNPHPVRAGDVAAQRGRSISRCKATRPAFACPVHFQASPVPGHLEIWLRGPATNCTGSSVGAQREREDAGVSARHIA
jgi:hypothetical protein